MSNCPVCQEDLFSSRNASHEMPCGHAIHWHCFKEMAKFDSRCPICKKTAESYEQMAPTWNAMAMAIALQPVPPEMAKVVSILCSDCEVRQENRSWHFFGVQCQYCTSFNTVVLETKLSGIQAAEFLAERARAGRQHANSSHATSPGNAPHFGHYPTIQGDLLPLDLERNASALGGAEPMFDDDVQDDNMST